MKYISFISLLILISSTQFDLLDSKSRNSDLLNLFSSSNRNLKEETPSPEMCQARPNPLNPDIFYFAPVYKAKLFKENDSNEFVSGCYKKNNATLKKLSKEETIIEIESYEKTYLFCNDIFIIHTSNINKLTVLSLTGKHTIKLKNLSDDDMDEIKLNSIKIMGFCQNMISSLKSLFYSLEAFIGGLGNNPDHIIPLFRPNIPKYQLEANLRMIDLYMNWKPEFRNESLININEKDIKTGDFIAISRFDGLDNIIMIGTGSHIGHSAVAAWIDGELYVIESQDGWYWPKSGIQRTKWSDWVKYAHIADFNVAILPIRNDINFNAEKAVKWFVEKAEGLDYGYRNFLFGWIDTPDKNMPFVIEHDHFELILTLLEKVSRSVSDMIVGEAVNMRLKTKGLSLPQVIAEAARRGMTFNELLAVKEEDDWVYSNGPNLVCSAFVVAFYKAGGVFDGLDVQATEFGPKDIYQMDIFDTNYKRPQECINADPNLPYCQIMGNLRIDLPGYNTIKPYNHMNEKCPSVGPDYIRLEGC